MLAPTFFLTQHNSYPASGWTQSDYPEQFPRYPPQEYIQNVNYVAPPLDLADYPVGFHLCLHDPAKYSPSLPQVAPGSAYHSGQYGTQPSGVAHFEYPPSDPNSLHHPTTYDTMGYFTDSHWQYCLPPGSQSQQNLVPDPSCYLRCDGSFDHYGTITQHSIPPVSSLSSSSELGNALVEIPSAEPQPMSCASIAFPSLPFPSHCSQPTPKHEPCHARTLHVWSSRGITSRILSRAI